METIPYLGCLLIAKSGLKHSALVGSDWLTLRLGQRGGQERGGSLSGSRQQCPEYERELNI